MWGIRFLNGPLAGQIWPLKNGANRLGRSPKADLRVELPGVSKIHLEMIVNADKILVNDLNSSNGTFVNGVRIRGALVKPGDKISVHQLLLEVVPHQGGKLLPGPRSQGASAPVPYQGGGAAAVQLQHPPAASHGHPAPAAYGQHPLAVAPDPQAHAHHGQAPPADIAGQVNKALQGSQNFIETVALPGVYRLPEVFSFQSVIMGFIGIYIIMVTLFAIVPMKQITAESIQNESYRRALTVARALASANERLIRSNDMGNFSVDMMIREEGIVDVYILSREGTLLAPPERVGSAPREIAFGRKIRGNPKEFTDNVENGQIAAAVPVLIFDPELQQNVAKAHAVVIYNPGSLAFDDGRAFSLFIQMLFLAFLVGGLLFYFLYKLIEHPFRLLNQELDQAMREGRDLAVIPFNLPVFQSLLTNLNSLMARAGSGHGGGQPVMTGRGARDQELANFMRVMGYPSILISADATIVRINPAFEDWTELSSEKLTGQKVSDIPDAAMQQNFQHLMGQSQMNMTQIVSDNLELRGRMFSLHCMAIASGAGDIEYYLITIMPTATEGGE